MLKNIQIKIVLIFLVIGVIAIGAVRVCQLFKYRESYI